MYIRVYICVYIYIYIYIYVYIYVYIRVTCNILIQFKTNIYVSNKIYNHIDLLQNDIIDML